MSGLLRFTFQVRDLDEAEHGTNGARQPMLRLVLIDPLNVRFSPKATEMVRRREMT